MDNQLPKGLTLHEINEEYLNDEYRMRRSKRLHAENVNNKSNSEELHAEPFQIEYNSFNLFKKSNQNPNQQAKNQNKLEEQLESKFNKLNKIDERPESRMSEASNEQKRKMSIKNVVKKQEFATKLRQNVSEIRAKRNNSIQSRKQEPQDKAPRSKSSDSRLSTGSSETDTSYYDVKPPPVKKNVIKPEERRVSNINNLRKPTQGVQPKKIEVKNDDDDEKMKKVRAFQMQGFHPYYDSEADVLGLTCFTCCMPTCKKCNNAFRGCSNMISFPVYCWVLVIIPIFLVIIITTIVLFAVGANSRSS